MATDAITSKIRQAEFHLSKITEVADDFTVECHFAALLACVRSVVLYVDHWLNTDRNIAKKEDRFERIHAWEDALATDDAERWKLLTRLRNQDIHEEPIIPDAQQGGYFGDYFGSDYFGPYFGGKGVRQITDPKTGKTYDIQDVCERSIATAKKLLLDFQKL